jgi:hypothetical protein
MTRTPRETYHRDSMMGVCTCWCRQRWEHRPHARSEGPREESTPAPGEAPPALGRNSDLNVGRACEAHSATWEFGYKLSICSRCRGKPWKTSIELDGRRTLRMQTDSWPAVWNLNTGTLALVPYLAVALFWNFYRTWLNVYSFGWTTNSGCRVRRVGKSTFALVPTDSSLSRRLRYKLFSKHSYS